MSKTSNKLRKLEADNKYLREINSRLNIALTELQLLQYQIQINLLPKIPEENWPAILAAVPSDTKFTLGHPQIRFYGIEHYQQWLIESLRKVKDA